MFSTSGSSHVHGLTYWVRVSINCTFIGSSTVWSRTPFCTLILTNIVGWVLLMLASNISTIWIKDRGAVSACKLMVSNMLSGSNEIIWTVWSSQPMACQTLSMTAVQSCWLYSQDMVCAATLQASCQHSMPKLYFPLPSSPDTHLIAHPNPIKIGQFHWTQHNHHLSLIHSSRDYSLALGDSPLVDPLVG